MPALRRAHLPGSAPHRHRPLPQLRLRRAAADRSGFRPRLIATPFPAGPRRSQQRILQAAAVAAAASGAPSFAVALSRSSPRDAIGLALGATRAIGTMAPGGRPSLPRGVFLHGVISLLVAEALGRVLPREHSMAWGAAAGLTVGTVALGVIAPRRFPALAALPLGRQLLDNAAFGAVFAAVADR